MNCKNMISYMTLLELINNGTQAEYVYLVLNVSVANKVKYRWDKYAGAYILDDPTNDENDDYNYYLRDSLLDYQSFDQLIEIINDVPKLPDEIIMQESDGAESYTKSFLADKINGILRYLKSKEDEIE